MIKLNSSIEDLAKKTDDLKNIVSEAQNSSTNIKKKIQIVLQKFKVKFEENEEFFYRFLVLPFLIS